MIRWGWWRPRPKPVAPALPLRAAVGIVAHRCDDAEIAELLRLGVRHVRTTYYTALDAQDAEYDAVFGARIAAVRAAGIMPLVVVHDLRGADETVACMCAALAAQHPGTRWQIGNEWDADPASAWRTGDAYAALMRRVVPAICAVDPSAGVVSMGLATAGDDAARHTAFLAAYRAAGGPRLDAWCIHTYGVPLLDAFQFLTANAARDLAGWMPLWVTEFGIEGAQMRAAYGAVTLSTIDTLQAQSWRSVLAAATAAGVTRCYGYALESGDDDGHGLLRRDGTERPACDVVRASLLRT